MADKAISDLTQALQITGEDLFVLEQSGEAKKLKGSQVVQYAKDAVEAEVQGVKEYADNAKASADAAAASATKAASAAQGIDDKVAAADASAQAAASSAAAAAASATGVDEKVQAAQTAADNAAKSETAAKNAQTAAVNAQKAAETAQTGAQSAKTAAESAQEAAESAKDAAADSSTAAGQKASQAAQSAEDAASAKSAAETAKTDAQAARDAIVNMIVEAVTLASGSDATVSKSVVDNVFKLAFGIPRGNPGADAPTITGITIRQSDYHMIVSLSDGTTYDAGYCRGAAGAGSGDMLASVYDPRNKHQDIFAYVDKAIKDVKVTTDATPTQGSTNPVQSGGVYSALANKLDKTGDGSNVTAAFTAASTRANIATGEKLSVLFGKIAKWFGDLGSLAFKSTVAKSDLASDVQTSLGKADSALQSAPVTSVNGQTGNVMVDTGGIFWVNVTWGDSGYVADKTFADIKAAILAGKDCRVKASPNVFVCTQAVKASDTLIVFGCTILISSRRMFRHLEISNDESVTRDDGFLPYWTTSLSEPEVGKLLKWADTTGWLGKATPETDYASPVFMRKVTLTTAGWNSSTKQQSVTVTGVLADTTKQCIYPAPVDTSYDSAWNSCGVLCVAQAANSLTFQCSEIPTSAIEVYVTVITLSYKG